MFGGFGMNMFGGLGNMFSGFGMNMFGGFGNMFSGFGMNMFGDFGINLFGNSNTNSCNCCNGKNKQDNNYDKYDRYKKTAKVKETITETPDKEVKTKKTTQENNKINGKPIKELTLADIAGISKKDYRKLSDELKTELKNQLADLITEDNATIKNILSNKKFPEDLKRVINYKIANLEPTNPIIENVNTVDQETEPTIKEQPVETISKNTIKIGNVNKDINTLTVEDINGITYENYTALNDTLKKELQNKIYNFAKENKDNALKWAKAETLPSDLRATAKRSFYVSGYTNVYLNTLTDAEIKKLKTVIDTSEIDDFKNIKNITNIERENGELKSFNMTAHSGTSVTYVRVTVIDGELIFHGKNTDQNYVLQKDEMDNYHLMQYEYHKGNGTPDVRNNS